MSEEVEESEGVIYSVEEARWNWSRVLHAQETLVTPAAEDEALAGSSCVAVPEFVAAVRSQ